MAPFPEKPNVVAILNSNDDVVELLRDLLERAGFVTVTGHIDAVRRGELDLVNFVKQHDPSVIVYDLVPPYDRSWNYLRLLQQSEPLRGRAFVLTSVNAARASEVVGRDAQIYEIVGRPIDLDEILQAVREASRSRAVSHGGGRH